ncbi:hypothetical protein GCM10010266_65480 [Streptomyces griseomycini]|nr:hypothetical protein GCM10010266_65480 [Streptomyces griseomycini]
MRRHDQWACPGLGVSKIGRRPLSCPGTHPHTAPNTRIERESVHCSFPKAPPHGSGTERPIGGRPGPPFAERPPWKGPPGRRTATQTTVARNVLGLRPLWRLKAALKPKASA